MISCGNVALWQFRLLDANEMKNIVDLLWYDAKSMNNI